MVNGDINGDESNANDLAFVFDPDDPATPPDIAAAMRGCSTTRTTWPPATCVRTSAGSRAETARSRHGTAGWTCGSRRRWERSGDRRRSWWWTCSTSRNLLDRDWGGQFLLPAGISNQNPVIQRVPLLNVIGFDQATQRYLYSVNESFGVLQKQGDPYQIQIGMRYVF